MADIGGKSRSAQAVMLQCIGAFAALRVISGRRSIAVAFEAGLRGRAAAVYGCAITLYHR
jgi:hypothetical protein